jgi:hypothetical protein
MPAMNADDRTEKLAGMQAEAPPEAFAGVCALASQVLTPLDFATLRARLDLPTVAAA